VHLHVLKAKLRGRVPTAAACHSGDTFRGRRRPGGAACVRQGAARRNRRRTRLAARHRARPAPHEFAPRRAARHGGRPRTVAVAQRARPLKRDRIPPGFRDTHRPRLGQVRRQQILLFWRAVQDTEYMMRFRAGGHAPADPHSRARGQGRQISENLARTASIAGLEPRGRSRSKARTAVRSSMASTRRAFRTVRSSFNAAITPMLTKSSLLPLVVIEPTEAGCDSTRFSRTSTAPVTCCR
jgi:hypothetical protein